MAFTLKSAQFRRERQKKWRELEELLKRIDRVGIRRLKAHQMAKLLELYQAAVSSLSVARSISLDRNTTEYLESLVSKSYLRVYGNKKGFIQSIAEFYLSVFPRAVRTHRYYLLASVLILLLGAVAGFTLVRQNSDYYYTFVGELAGGRTPDSSYQELYEVIYEEDKPSLGDLSFFASYLLSNNSQVAMLCFVVGAIPFCLVFYLLFKNGLVLGAFVEIYDDHGLAFDLFGWLLPHGVPELFAIFLGGAGGLAISKSILFPGRQSVSTSLKRAARSSSVLLLGALSLLVVAAVIEGYFRQLVTDPALRYSMVALMVALHLLYFGFVGRRAVHEETDLL